MCYETLSAASTNGFDEHTSEKLLSDVEARLRYILQILPKSMRTEYADRVWDNLRAAVGWGDDDKVAANDIADDDGLGWWWGGVAKTKTEVKLIDWYNSTERVISVVSEFIPGYAPPKRFPSSGIKREGRVTIVWWDTYGVRTYCGDYDDGCLLCCFHEI